MIGRYLSENEYASLTQAFRTLVRLCGGPSASARIARVSQQQISRYMSSDPEHATQFPALDVIADLEAECEQPTVTRLLAEMEGFVLVPMPKAASMCDSMELIARVSTVLSEVSDVSGGVADALKDGHITHAETKKLHKEVLEAQEALAALDQQISVVARRDDHKREWQS